ncbi:putative protein TPRXL isoform X3 [Salmo trutta]|uniref:putative protein TPRXL isoform X3 n=1 Tax=Salmo trutta TaxID=8032 RepID=UPI0011309278|nr:putative protein TPRXL isoform X3 [Salmo trutta]
MLLCGFYFHFYFHVSFLILFTFLFCLFLFIHHTIHLALHSFAFLLNIHPVHRANVSPFFFSLYSSSPYSLHVFSFIQDLTDDSNDLFPTSFYLPSSSPTSDSPPPSLSHDSFSQSKSLMPTMSGSGSGLSASTSLPATSPPAIFSFSIPYPSDLTITPSPYSSSSSPSTSSPSPSPSPSPPPANVPSTSLSNSLFPDLPLSHEPLPPSSSDSSYPSSSSSSSSPPPTSVTLSVAPPSSVSLTPSSVPIQLNGVYSFTDGPDNIADPTAMSTSSGVDHAVIGGVVAVIVFILLCLLIVLGRYLIRHKGTYLTHEAKGSDDAPDADTAIINAEGGHSGAEDKKEYFI